MNRESRETPNQDFIYGAWPVMEALKASKEFEKVLIQHGLRNEVIKEVISELKHLDIPFQFVPIEKLNRVTRKNHQGIIAYLSPVTFSRIEQVLPAIYEKGEDPFLLILDKITDVRNFGAILRTASCTGVHAVVIPVKGSALLNSDTVKSSAGAIYTLPICRSENLKDSIEYLKNSGLKILAATEKGEEVYYNEKLTGPVALIMGSEGEGISPEYLKRSDLLVRIPMTGTIDSLNVSVAAGVLLYEIFRQRNQ
ncbi:MAG: 23S rRNA (guanosine(2251)-2'-O)-methyltransferase RlmB [Bacteroidetes bacterium CG18_big_fil_WC_8_21_14_2_50_41_14]|nr:MAG: 23S rRNA (guanosine(2251)-2'-O)-methyltransferase RlmB [Bacteroidetes bacterium CG18_big_fil_WC_8_21_14_2_50_41_14]PJB58409.1 MAG: 23S rRNA (guanosine(2251)-2'-O)-methyltransferase RlmB [Bacteroidetes bacterium CG_4_9_14_3_um_filter_41_19]